MIWKPRVCAALLVGLTLGCAGVRQPQLTPVYVESVPEIERHSEWALVDQMDSVLRRLEVPSLQEVTLPPGTTEIRIEAGYTGYIRWHRILRIVDAPGGIQAQYFAFRPDSGLPYAPVFIRMPPWRSILARLDSAEVRTLRNPRDVVTTIVDAEELRVEVLVGGKYRAYRFNGMRGRGGADEQALRIFDLTLGLHALIAPCSYEGFPPGTTQWRIVGSDGNVQETDRPECIVDGLGDG